MLIKINSLRNSRVFINTITLIFGSAIGQAILLITTPIITRLYRPEDFGLLAIFVGILSISSIISSLRYELAIPLTQSLKSAYCLVILAFMLNAATSISVAIFILICHKDIAVWLNNPILMSYLWLIPLGMLGAGTYRILNYFSIREKHFKNVAKTKLWQNISNVSLQVAGGFAGIGAIGLILGQLVGQITGIVQLGKKLPLPFLFQTSKRSILRTKSLAKKYIYFPKFDSPAALVDVIGNQLPNILLASLYSPAVAGYYMLADRMLASPMSLVGQAIAQVFYGECRQALKVGNINKLTLKIIFIQLILITPVGFIVYIYGSEIFSYIFGHKWLNSGIYAEWLVIGAIAQFIYSPLSMLLMATGGQKINFYIHALMLIFKGLSLLYCFSFKNELIAIIMISIINFIGYVIGIAIILHRANRFSIQTLKIA